MLVSVKIGGDYDASIKNVRLTHVNLFLYR